MQFYFSLRKVLFFIFVLAILTAPAFAGPDDTVSIAIEYDVGTVNALETKTGNDLLLIHMHEALMFFDPVTGDFTPNLADTVEMMPSGKDVNVQLKKGHLFHTGEPVTAFDVKWTYEKAVSPEYAHLFAGILDEIETIEVIDDQNLIIHFFEKYAPWLEPMQLGICSKKYFETVGSETFAKKPVGSGPFRFISRDPGKNIILESVKGYTYYDHLYNKEKTKIVEKNATKETIDFKTLKLVVVRDRISRLEMLESGEIDLIYSILPHDIKRLQADKKIRLKKISQVPSFYALALSPIPFPLMTDRNFVLAINHAIDRQGVVDKIFLGEGYPLYMFAGKNEIAYDPSIVYEYNPHKARAYVKKSSYKPGDPIFLTYNSGVPSSNLIAIVMQKNLENVGINAKTQEIEYDKYASLIRERDPRVGHLSMYAWHGPRDPQIRLLLTCLSSSIYTTYPDRPSKDILDKLVMDQSRETDPEKRLAILRKIYKILDKEQGSIALFGLNQIYAMRNRIDYTWTTNQGYLYNLHRVKIVKQGAARGNN